VILEPAGVVTAGEAKVKRAAGDTKKPEDMVLGL
jgi:hypothetical protein